jgi:hypothetical protein
MTESKMTSWQKTLAWIAGIGAVMVLLGYATFEQWAGLVGALFGGVNS